MRENKFKLLREKVEKYSVKMLREIFWLVNVTAIILEIACGFVMIYLSEYVRKMDWETARKYPHWIAFVFAALNLFLLTFFHFHAIWLDNFTIWLDNELENLRKSNLVHFNLIPYVFSKINEKSKTEVSHYPIFLYL